MARARKCVRCIHGYALVHRAERLALRNVEAVPALHAPRPGVTPPPPPPLARATLKFQHLTEITCVVRGRREKTQETTIAS